MEVMRKFIINLKPEGTMEWAEVCDEPNVEQRVYKNVEQRVYKRIADHCKAMMYLNKGKDLYMYLAYKEILGLCKFW